MTDGEGRARFEYTEGPEVRGQEQEQEEEEEEVHEEVRVAIQTPYRSDAPGHNVNQEEEEEEEEEEEVERKTRSSSGGEWSPEVEELEEQEPEMEVGPPLGVRIHAPIRDPDCVSEEEEQQPYPALAPVAFFCLKQTTRPRNWCLRVVCNPYPF
ncbi:coiled-coil domain-containing glutamate-rich protein 1-like [Notolabrus celidotus]|uniref:coiled-coil domain-containing glutamate-rich protein 1-like n=1 Tax=Notolabrus celidotus TaxID=1203425 RepID=UPI0014903BF8|nr:coiled-coil domain-containing glutamate-rich protein 1-like [Notolabrus celidotus]XP_034566515.1 coiled-coil domain-containing glutamate-rich protein 1-like [Notolabrus celidotus]XP_034566516.1 coiled-coil domain-containing glutamate-rich protein 1-like [Notolabrus celidotus]XP_034566517.1 coiled-coil domain-containing glutamate-rich protein 1-like [Notolabrus celidotus]